MRLQHRCFPVHFANIYLFWNLQTAASDYSFTLVIYLKKNYFMKRKLWSFMVKKMFIEIGLCNPMTYDFKEHAKMVEIYMVKFNVLTLNRLKMMGFIVICHFKKNCNQTFHYFNKIFFFISEHYKATLKQFISTHLKDLIRLLQKIVFLIWIQATVYEILKNKILKKDWLSKNFINLNTISSKL